MKSADFVPHRVESEGVTMSSSVVLPPHATRNTPEAAVDDPATRPITGQRILVVDDNEDAAWLLAEALRMLGHDVRTSFDGHSALELAREWPPQIAFLDIGLPGMDGFSLCRHLLELPARPHVIAVTGYGQANDRERAREAGFDAHFVKPVSLRDVQSAIETFGRN
jgi:CheY-like chemotaxis protein